MTPFNFDFSFEKFSKLIPKNTEKDMWYAAFDLYLPEYDIFSISRVTAFLSQVIHESAQLTVLTENLNYSSEGLLKVFPKYFDLSNVAGYARNPEKIANRVYANRLGNNYESSGDGYLYRGRGILQITGRITYQTFWTDMNLPEPLNPELVASDKEYALLSAIWFWKRNKLNITADSGNIKDVTKRVNGGFNGLEERTTIFEKAKQLFS